MVTRSGVTLYYLDGDWAHELRVLLRASPPTRLFAASPRRRLLAPKQRAQHRHRWSHKRMAPRRLILDGSMGHTLKQRGLSDSFAEAAYANLRQPELVTSVHSEVSAAPSERTYTRS